MSKNDNKKNILDIKITKEKKTIYAKAHFGHYFNIKNPEVRERTRDSELWRSSAGKSSFGGGLYKQLMLTRLKTLQ